MTSRSLGRTVRPRQAPGMVRETERTGDVHLQAFPDPVNRNTCEKARFLGPVDIHPAAITTAAEGNVARKPGPVPSQRVATARNSLILTKRFPIRCRHPYITPSCPRTPFRFPRGNHRLRTAPTGFPYGPVHVEGPVADGCAGRPALHRLRRTPRALSGGVPQLSLPHT